MTLKSLRWKDIVSAKGDDAARYGLDRPELEVTLAKAGDAELGTLLIGTREGDVDPCQAQVRTGDLRRGRQAPRAICARLPRRYPARKLEPAAASSRTADCAAQSALERRSLRHVPSSS